MSLGCQAVLYITVKIHSILLVRGPHATHEHHFQDLRINEPMGKAMPLSAPGCLLGSDLTRMKDLAGSSQPDLVL